MTTPRTKSIRVRNARRKVMELNKRKKLSDRLLSNFRMGNSEIVQRLETRLQSLPISFEDPLDEAQIEKIKLSERIMLNKIDKTGQTLLLKAIKKNNLLLVDLLIKKGANPNLTGIEEDTPLILAISLGHVAIIKCLLDAGANPLPKSHPQPLHLAASSGLIACVDQLLKLKVSPNLTESKSKGLTPLMRAVKFDHKSTATLLLEAKAHVNVMDRTQKTALDYARENQNLDIMMLLFRYGAIITDPELFYLTLTLHENPNQPRIQECLNHPQIQEWLNHQDEPSQKDSLFFEEKSMSSKPTFFREPTIITKGIASKSDTVGKENTSSLGLLNATVYFKK